MGGVAKMPVGLCWLLLGVVLAFGVAASPAQEVHRSIFFFFSEGSAIYII